MKSRFVALVPEAINFHLPKDRGMIPYILEKYFGYDAKLACYGIGQYHLLDGEMKDLKLETFPKISGDIKLDTKKYIVKNALEIDVLQVYHINPLNIEIIDLYKKINPKGSVYLKLDAGIQSIELVIDDRLKQVLRKCKLISIEIKTLALYLTQKWEVKVEYIPNGWYDFYDLKDVSYSEKENIICTVGRIGAYEKGSDILMQAFSLIHEYIPNWKLRMVGPIVPGFETYITEFYKKYPDIKEKIEFTNYIVDRRILNNEYNKAKIFCLPSRTETFGIALVEAAKAGCFILCSNIPSSLELTNYNEYGRIFDVEDIKALAKLIVRYCHDEALLSVNCKKVQQFAKNNYNWIELCRKIDVLL